MLTAELKEQARKTAETISSIPHTSIQRSLIEEARLMREHAQRKASKWEGRNDKFFATYTDEAAYQDLVLDKYAQIKAADYQYVLDQQYAEERDVLYGRG